MKRKPKDPFAIPKSRLHSACRKLWLWSANRRQALANARVERGWYLCAGCHDLAPAKEIAVDHIERVGSVLEPGYFDRLFVHPDGLQVLCEKCHTEKTQKEKGRK